MCPIHLIDLNGLLSKIREDVPYPLNRPHGLLSKIREDVPYPLNRPQWSTIENKGGCALST